MIFATVMAIFALFATFGLALWLTWPEVPWTAVTITVAAIAGLTPAIGYSWAQTMWMAYDLYVHPLEDTELAAARQRVSPGL
ncbi:MAG: hypothetical protein ACT4OP_08355 [Actinomycetota bacterium]